MNVLELMRVWPQFAGPSWRPWRSVIAAHHGLPIEDPDLVLRVTGRKTLPRGPFRKGVRIIGRRGGKSIAAAIEVIYASICRTYPLAPGEIGRVLIIAPSRSQARVVLGYVSGLLKAAPSLADLIADEATEFIRLKNGIAIEIATASFRHVRGYTVVAAIVDEVAFLRADETSANPDSELFAALEPAMATVPNSLLLSISSPHGQAGVLWEEHREHFGKDDTDVLVVQAPSRLMNPELPQSVVDAAFKRDPEKARAEFGAEFRGLSAGLFHLDQLMEATIEAEEIPPEIATGATAFADMASGSGTDSATIAIAFPTSIPGRRVMVLAACREWRPPFNPSTIASECAALARSYGIRRIVMDRYATGWTDALFRQYGIEVVPSPKDKSEILLGFLCAMNAGDVLLLDNERVRSQALGLVRRITPGGKEIVEHSRQGDDLVNSVAGALVAGAEAARAGDGIRVRRISAF